MNHKPLFLAKDARKCTFKYRSSDKINIDRLAYFNRTIIEWLKNKYTYFCSIFWLVKFYNHVKVYIVRFKNL